MIFQSPIQGTIPYGKHRDKEPAKRVGNHAQGKLFELPSGQQDKRVLLALDLYA